MLVLVTTRIVYYRPDFPSLLNDFVWQCDDLAPSYPRVRSFLDHWRRDVRAVISCVEIATSTERGDWRGVDFEWRT